jgi:sugar lactone lactonase YvrE
VTVACVVVGSASCGSNGASPSGTSRAVERSTPASSTVSPTSPISTAESLFRDPIDVAIDDKGDVWVGDYRRSTLQMFRADDLASAGGETRIDPAVTLSEVGGPNQMEFDAQGNLWVVEWDEDAVVSFDRNALTADGPAQPTTLLTGPHLGKPTDLAFDAAGNLWVANQENGEILEYALGQLGSTGHPAPALVLQPSEVRSGSPEALAFDEQGWLWVSSYYDDVVLGFDPAAVSRSGEVTATARLDLDPASGPIGLTIDPGGRLWVAEALAHHVAAFGPDLGSTPSPATVLLADEALVMPHSVTFDRKGNAWIPCYNGTVLRFDRAQVQPGAEGPPTLILG